MLPSKKGRGRGNGSGGSKRGAGSRRGSLSSTRGRGRGQVHHQQSSIKHFATNVKNDDDKNSSMLQDVQDNKKEDEDYDEDKIDWNMEFMDDDADNDINYFGGDDNDLKGIESLDDAFTQSVTFEEWERRKINSSTEYSSTTTTITFQQLEIDHYIASKAIHKIPGIKNDQNVPVLRLYGVTENGISVCCHVHGFYPYFYVALPAGFKASHSHTLMTNLNNILKKDGICRIQRITQPILKITLVNKLNILGYDGDQKRTFAKITLAVPKLIYAAKSILETASVAIPDLGKCVYQAFESNLDFETRFMVDADIVGCNWIELPAGMYTIRNSSNLLNTSNNELTKDVELPSSRCQIETDIVFDKLISHSPIGLWSKVAPFRILSFDIECAGRKGVFPEPDKDPVIQIANMVIHQGEAEPFIRTIFTLNTCAPIIEAQVLSFSNEAEMLEAWADFVRKVDPDMLTGYNIKNFDLYYLLNRATHLKTTNFHFLGRIRNMKSVSRNVILQSKQMGRRENKSINIDGRVIFDLFLILVKDYKLRSYSLNAVSFHFLGQQKEDVHHSIITDLQNGNEISRKRLAIYCLKDALLPLKLLQKLMCVINYMEMARVTGVTLQYLLTRGQQVKVVSQILRKAKETGYIMPTYEPQQGKPIEQFDGATVIEPIRGYYDVPIATLDFASLYPSIMMAHNLCYTTVLRKSQICQLQADTFIESPSNNYFVKPSIRKGILPQILEDLLSARKRAKADLKNEKDPFKRQVLDGRQLALKMSANSVYGFTGAQVGKLPCLAISQSVTSYGRQMIAETKTQVEQKFCTENGYQHDAKVIYGDTDSVMVRFGVKTVAEAMALGNEAATFISTNFVSPIKLEFEKVYFPYLLVNKKRYAGLYFTKPDIHDKMDCKGLETVRRDNCPLVANVMNSCLELILLKHDPDGAVAYAKSIISQLFNNKIDLSQLVITKELTKTENQYKAKQAHVELANRMNERDPGTAPKLGDRVPYVIIAAAKKTPAYAKAEDPIYVLENNIPIDANHYLINQLSKPLIRIFQPILGEKTESDLLRGEHTRTKVLITSTVGPLSHHTFKLPKCIGCKTFLRPGDNIALCKHCLPNQTQIYLQQLSVQSELESKYNRLWSQCQRCQGSLHEKVLCTSRDCPIFYMRKKVILDVEDQDQLLQRFH